MKKIFISLLSVLVFSFIFSNLAVAQTPSLSDGSTVAYVHIYGNSLVSQQDRDFVISFSLASIAGAQPQVKYAVSVTKASSSNQTIYDEKVYDEVISLAKGESISRIINYILPASLPADTYRLVVKIKNGSGLMLASSFLADVKISSVAKTANNIEIVNDSCIYGSDSKQVVSTTTATSTYNIGAPVFISTPTVKCKVKSTFPSNIIVTPKFITKIRSSFGDIVSTFGGAVGGITIEKGSNNISFVLPQALKPQKYNLSFSLVSTDGKIVSNSISYDYQIDGAQGTIQNIVFDKTYYKAGETANLKIYSIQSSTSTITALVLDGNGVSCAATSSKEVGLFSLINFQIPIIKDCLNPKANITLTDINGNILDKNIYQITTTEGDKVQANTSTNTSIMESLIIILVIIILTIIIFAMKKTKKDKGLKALLLLIAISFSLFGVAKKIEAEVNVTIASDANGGGCKFERIGRTVRLGDHNQSICGQFDTWSNKVTSLYVANTCAFACSLNDFTGNCGTFAQTNDTGGNEWYNLNELNYGVPNDDMDSISPISCPSAPAGINYTCNADQVTLSWPTVDHAMGYALRVVPSSKITDGTWTNNCATNVSHGFICENMIGNSKPMYIIPNVDYSAWVQSTYNAKTSPYFGALSPTAATKSFYCPIPTIEYQRNVPGAGMESNGGNPVTYGDTATIIFTAGADYSKTGGCDISASDNSILPQKFFGPSKSINVQISPESFTTNQNPKATFDMVCHGSEGHTVAAQTLFIDVIKPKAIDFSAASTTLPYGNTGTTLTWDSRKSYQCTIKRDDQSSSSIWVNNTINKFYSSDNFFGSNSFSQPSAIIVDDYSDIYVADVGSQNIKMFNPLGKLVQNLPSTISNLSGISQIYKDTLAVSNTTGGVLNIYNYDPNIGDDGAFQTTPEGSYNFSTPTGVYYTPNYTYIATNNKLVRSDLQTRYGTSNLYNGASISAINVDTMNNIYFNDGDTIKKLANGTITTWGSTGSADGQFNNPKGITSEFITGVNPNVYVADTGNNRIQKLDSTTSKFNTVNVDKTLSNPYGIAIDPSFNMFVADTGSNNVYRFEPEISSSTNTGPLSATTTFTIKCNYPGAYGYGATSQTNSVTVSVLPAVISVDAQINSYFADSYSVLSGSSTILHWVAANTDSCTIKKDGVALNSTSTSGQISTGPINATSTFVLDCVKTDTKTTHDVKSIDVGITSPQPYVGPVDRHFPAGLTALPSEMVWVAEEGASCVLKKGGVTGDIVGEGGSYGSYVQEDLPEGITFVLQCSVDGANKPIVTAISVPPAVRSTCTASQFGSTPGNIYVNKSMSWKVDLSLVGGNITAITGRTISGTDIATTTYDSSNIPNPFSKIYTTVGVKNIKIITYGKRDNPIAPDFTSVCSTSTPVKLDSGGGGEI